jgi:hypothetical protein
MLHWEALTFTSINAFPCYALLQLLLAADDFIGIGKL